VNFFNNGIVIQSLNHEWPDFHDMVDYLSSQNNDEVLSEKLRLRSYFGFSRYQSWPLGSETDAISKILNKETENWFLDHYSDDSLDIMPEKDFCIRYIKHCHEMGIKTRTLFCQTERESPLWKSDIPELKFLGYELTDIGFYSYITEDLLSEPIEKYLNYQLYKRMIDCRSLLNEFMLFNEEIDVINYVESRNEIIKSDIEWSTVIHNGVEGRAHLVEDNENPIIFKLFEVVGEI
jgi:hypothetical protein